jgi:glycosyltransferase involved in cell wall biosynthesis
LEIALIGSKGMPVTFGGVENGVASLSYNYVKQGHDVTVYSRKYYSKVNKKEFYINGVKVININAIRSKRLDVISHSFIAALKAAFGKYDIVAFHSTVPGFFCFIPRIFGKKVFFHSHGMEIFGNKWNIIDKLIMLLGMRFSSFFFNAYTTVSYSQMPLYEKYYSKKPELIPNGINFKKRDIKKIKNRNILFVGRIVKDKGVEILIEAFNSLCSKYPEFNLQIVGAPSYSSDYYDKLKQISNNNKNINFLGEKYGDDLIKLYEESYCIVIPSLIESFSYVLLESLMYNGVVLCSDIEQFKYLATDYALFFKSKSSEDLTKKLESLITNNEFYNSINNKSEYFPFADYSWINISEKYLSLYKKHLCK